MLTQPGGLAARLRALREAASLTGTALATDLAKANPDQNWPDSSKVTKIERGRQLPTVHEIKAWCRACSVTEAVEAALVASRGRAGTWRQRAETGMADIQESLLELYRSTTHTTTVEISTVPGLFQIEDYARRILTDLATTHLGHDPDPADIDQAVRARLRRQEMLYDADKQFDVLITEPVLRWAYAPPSVMAAQMDRLLTAQSLSNVRFGIVPLASATPIIIENSFHVFDELVIVETSAAEYQHQADDEAAAFLSRLDRYWPSAVEGNEARALIVAASDRHRAS